MKPIFISGIGTDVGKTIVSSIVVNALGADYWKPVQAGFDAGTDAETIASLLSRPEIRIHPEVYKLRLPASPHIAARQEGIYIDLDTISSQLPQTERTLVIEGAGGLMVPLNEKEFMADLIQRLDASVILVSRNYLGSINHSLLTAEACRTRNLRVLGWIFTDKYGDYQQAVADWSGYPILGSIPWLYTVDSDSIRQQADLLEPTLSSIIESDRI